jgi:hypothetical protein
MTRTVSGFLSINLIFGKCRGILFYCSELRHSPHSVKGGVKASRVGRLQLDRKRAYHIEKLVKPFVGRQYAVEERIFETRPSQTLEQQKLTGGTVAPHTASKINKFRELNRKTEYPQARARAAGRGFRLLRIERTHTKIRSAHNDILAQAQKLYIASDRDHVEGHASRQHAISAWNHVVETGYAGMRH